MSMNTNNITFKLTAPQVASLNTQFRKILSPHANGTKLSTINNLFAKSLGYKRGYGNFFQAVRRGDYCFQIEDVDIKGLVEVIVDNDIAFEGPDVFVKMYLEITKKLGKFETLYILSRFIGLYWVHMEMYYPLSHILNPRAQSIQFWNSICKSARWHKKASIKVRFDGRVDYRNIYTQSQANTLLGNINLKERSSLKEALRFSSNESEMLNRICDFANGTNGTNGTNKDIFLLVVCNALMSKCRDKFLPSPFLHTCKVSEGTSHSISHHYVEILNLHQEQWSRYVTECISSYPSYKSFLHSWASKNDMDLDIA